MENAYLIFLAIITLFTLLCCTIGLFLYACGITKTVEVSAGAPPIGQVTVAYKFARGPYKDSGSLFQDAVIFSPPNSRTIGIYYDDPNVIPKEKLRYAVGVILSENGIKVEKEVQDKIVAEGFKIIKLPKVNHCVRSDFPFINFLSCMIAVWRVYPKLSKYIKDHALCAYPMIEVYESKLIKFMAPLSQQEDFYVPEAKENIPEEYLQYNADSSVDRSLLDSMRDSADRSSRGSSLSTFSRSYISSRYEEDNLSDEEDPDVEEEKEDVQDDEVTSSVDVRPSKACTNLLEESDLKENVSYKEDGTILTENESITEDLLMAGAKDNSLLQGDDSANLQDSGICSGRTSTSPTENDSLTEVVKGSADHDGEDSSSSSFEEIKMETVEKEL